MAAISFACVAPNGKGGPDCTYRGTMTLTGAMRLPESKPNDQFAQVNRILLHTPIAETINLAGDAGAFSFYSNQSHMVTIRASESSANTKNQAPLPRSLESGIPPTWAIGELPSA